MLNSAKYLLKAQRMWITQTYLKSPEPDAKLHVYYLYREYIEQEVEITRQIQSSLERMGSRFGGDVAILMPSLEAADRIEKEVRQIKPLWQMVLGRLPGVLICTRPMIDIRFEDGEHYFVSFDRPECAEINAENLKKISELVSDQLDYQHREISDKEVSLGGAGNRFFDAIELKPGIAGFRIDLKKLLKAR